MLEEDFEIDHMSEQSEQALLKDRIYLCCLVARDTLVLSRRLAHTCAVENAIQEEAILKGCIGPLAPNWGHSMRSIPQQHCSWATDLGAPNPVHHTCTLTNIRPLPTGVTACAASHSSTALGPLILEHHTLYTTPVL